MASRGLPQVEYAAARRGADLDGLLDRLGLPLFVKPARLGSSVGISKVASDDELRRRARARFRHDPVAIVEAFARGMEVECSVIGNGSDPRRRCRARSSCRAPSGTTTRPSTRSAGWSSWCRRGCRSRWCERGALARRGGLRGGGLRGLRAGRLLRRGRRARARQRAQHDARLHATSGFPKMWEATGRAVPPSCSTGCSSWRSSATASERGTRTRLRLAPELISAISTPGRPAAAS